MFFRIRSIQYIQILAELLYAVQCSGFHFLYQEHGQTMTHEFITHVTVISTVF